MLSFNVLSLHQDHQDVINPVLRQLYRLVNVLDLLKLLTTPVRIENHVFAAVESIAKSLQFVSWISEESVSAGGLGESITEVIQKAAGCAGDNLDQSGRDSSGMLEPVCTRFTVRLPVVSLAEKKPRTYSE